MLDCFSHVSNIYVNNGFYMEEHLIIRICSLVVLYALTMHPFPPKLETFQFHFTNYLNYNRL